MASDNAVSMIQPTFPMCVPSTMVTSHHEVPTPLLNALAVPLSVTSKRVFLDSLPTIDVLYLLGSLTSQTFSVLVYFPTATGSAMVAAPVDVGFALHNPAACANVSLGTSLDLTANGNLLNLPAASFSHPHCTDP